MTDNDNTAAQARVEQLEKAVNEAATAIKYMYVIMQQMHSVNEHTYTERSHLLALLATHYPSRIDRTGDPECDNYAVLRLDLPNGQATWHIHPDDLHLFTHVDDGDINYDGHTTEEKYTRLQEITQGRT